MRHCLEIGGARQKDCRIACLICKEVVRELASWLDNIRAINLCVIRLRPLLQHMLDLFPREKMHINGDCTGAVGFAMPSSWSRPKMSLSKGSLFGCF